MKKHPKPPPPPPDPNAAPPGLSPEAVAQWDKLVTEWELDDASRLILRCALEALDRMRQAQAIIAAEGITTKDRFGQPKQHPATLVERDARASLARLMSQLNLDLEPLRDRAGRPSGK